MMVGTIRQMEIASIMDDMMFVMALSNASFVLS